MKLPSAFEAEMKQLLGEDYPLYADSLTHCPARGLRVNEMKISVAGFLALRRKYGLPDPEPVPWVHDGFYVPEDEDAAGSPLYFAGLYYLQDPSAMTPAENLPVRAGDRILDLCAAPGGKATELLARLEKAERESDGRRGGILYANDISASRAKALRKNIERMGGTRVFVTAETPERLALHFPGYFDKILIDAPCSGEGMFRTQPAMMKHWEEEGPAYYAAIQETILEQAYSMLAPGGMILYSTCTYSVMEDEAMVERMLVRHADLAAESLREYSGFSHISAGKLLDCLGEELAEEYGLTEKVLMERYGSLEHELPYVRLYPHRVRGEGQFAALIRKRSEEEDASEPQSRGDAPDVQAAGTFSETPENPDAVKHAENLSDPCAAFHEYTSGGEVHLLPAGYRPSPGLHYLLTGVHKGTKKDEGFLPSQSYAMTRSAASWPDVIDMAADDIRAMKYLRGETLLLTEKEMKAAPAKDTGKKKRKTGAAGRAGRPDKKTDRTKQEMTLVTVDGYPLGFGKRNGPRLKNGLAPGWRKL
jgi:16S rRNA C967 or C1407 C5-methylase (RsmB/RsmF family)/NOL1/NOP2/fmu family ribosome biogenesis protein